MKKIGKKLKAVIREILAIYYEIFLSYKILTIGFIYFNSEKEGFKKKLKNCNLTHE